MTMSTRRKSGETIRVLIVDDSTPTRQFLKDHIQAKGMFVVAVATSALDGIEKFRQHHPDLTLMDMKLSSRRSDMDGTEAIKSIRQEFPDARIIAITEQGDTDEDRIKALSGAVVAGAQGIYLKTDDEITLIHTMREVMAGKKCIPDTVCRMMADQLFDEKDRQILRLLMFTDKEIAAITGIPENTINGRLNKIYDNLETRNRTEALFIAIHRRFLLTDEIEEARTRGKATLHKQSHP